MKTTRLLPADAIRRNLRMLIDLWPMDIEELAQRSKVTKRMIHFILSGERKPGIDTTEALANVFGITGWAMLLSDLSIDLVKSGTLVRMVEDYSRSPRATRQYIDDMAHRDANNIPISNAAIASTPVIKGRR